MGENPSRQVDPKELDPTVGWQESENLGERHGRIPSTHKGGAPTRERLRAPAFKPGKPGVLGTGGDLRVRAHAMEGP
jgi:hypothetical protein